MPRKLRIEYSGAIYHVMSRVIGVMIGFAGPRVIEDTTQAELPPGFKTAEFLLDHGLTAPNAKI